MKCTINIEMDNAAFEEAAGAELAEILREVARRIEHLDRTSFEAYASVGSGRLDRVRDGNGNTVGSVEVTS